MASKPGCQCDPGMSLAGARLLARWCPACRRRESGLRLPYGTWEGGRGNCPWHGFVVSGARGRALSGRNREVLSTVAARAGGPVRSSGEALVISVERRDRLICGLCTRATRVVVWEETSGQVRSEGQTVSDTEGAVWEAYKSVKRNKGAAGVDGQSIEEFEADLKDNLYKIWNRMSSGSYLPSPVRAVEIPKSHGGGTRVLGIPTVADRIAQTVVALWLEPRTESIFHDDSYGYRPGRSPLDAVAKCRERCWKKDWVLDLDVQQFFDSVDHDLMVKAVAANTDQNWV